MGFYLLSFGAGGSIFYLLGEGSPPSPTDSLSALADLMDIIPQTDLICRGCDSLVRHPVEVGPIRRGGAPAIFP